VLEPSFIYHSVFVHSHMASAIFLLMALTSMWMAAPPSVVRGETEIEPVFIVLAGVFTAGLAMSRPDGPAYQFVPVAVAISVLTLSKVRWRTVAAYFAPLLFLVISANAAAFAQLGVWQSTKLSGRTTLVILGVLAFAAVGPWIVELLDRFSPVRLSGERFLSVLVSVSAALMLVVFALKWETVRFALAHARINLFQGAGGYSYLWYGVVAVLVLSVLTRDALRTGSWTRSPFLAIALYAVVAGLIHGMAHPGRLGPGDSLNRTAFQVVPLVVWYAGAVVARILGPSEAAEESEQA
jgi:hypothetical protein